MVFFKRRLCKIAFQTCFVSNRFEMLFYMAFFTFSLFELVYVFTVFLHLK